MPLLVAHAAHGLDAGLVGVPLVPVAVVALLEDVLAAPVPGELVAHPPAWKREPGLSAASGVVGPVGQPSPFRGPRGALRAAPDPPPTKPWCGSGCANAKQCRRQRGREERGETLLRPSSLPSAPRAAGDGHDGPGL